MSRLQPPREAMNLGCSICSVGLSGIADLQAREGFCQAVKNIGCSSLPSLLLSLPWNGRRIELKKVLGHLLYLQLLAPLVFDVTLFCKRCSKLPCLRSLTWHHGEVENVKVCLPALSPICFVMSRLSTPVMDLVAVQVGKIPTSQRPFKS